MGEALYAAAAERYGPLRLRAYAPVGGHEELLPYLVRRLLENGANSSFVHVLLDESVPASAVAADPIARVEAQPGRHPRIPVPRDVYGAARANPIGRDLSQATIRGEAARQLAALEQVVAGPIIGGQVLTAGARPVASPADRRLMIGEVAQSAAAHLEEAIERARAVQPAWNRIGGKTRAEVLRAMGDALEARMDRLIALLAREGGKTYGDSVAEVREAVDYCRYYAVLAEQQFGQPKRLPGPVGETNHWELSGRGVFACISPWNFPLAIFTGQIAAALAAGNAVVAKPAEQTSLVAADAVRLFHAAGLDPDLLALLPGEGGTIGAALVAHPGIDGVAFTGGTDTAWAINRTLAARPGPIIPFIAETGGLNAMFVDTTALREQVIDDVVTSAFGSAGQRCSALRMLFLPRDTADTIVEGLRGALLVRRLGDPALPETDIGPVIDAEAKAALERHLARLEREARIVARHPGVALDGHFFAPVIAEVTAPDFLEHEVFGPILHVCRYDPDNLEPYAARLAALGYGLTLGVHSRIEAFAERIKALIPAGNVYVNRSMIGAVVGVQPFGGVGLSGTGPKAGGPHSLIRFAHERAVAVNIMAQGGDPGLLSL
jgi:RHH-type proline utilization regulon transcriptional repressor/proline dehydrogenase/delta 1-pyrroline-5-carboxylate dehydrogenase